MIPVTELRQGNWFKEGIFKQFDFRNDDSWHTDNFDPIPLTPEILEKCGFRHYAENDSFQFEGKYGFILWSGNHNNPRTLNLYCESDELGCDVKFLHQLQNLYFALTGEELQIDL